MTPSVLRVLHVLPHRGGGAETYIDLLAALPGSAHARVALSRSPAPLDALRSLPGGVPGLVRQRRRADIVHVHGDAAALIALPLLAASPAVITTHGLHMLRRAVGPRGRAVRVGVTSAVRAAAATLCCSEEERDELRTMLPALLHRRLVLARNGTALPQLDQSERHAARAALGLAPDAVVALFLGELSARKDPLTAVRAAVAAANRLDRPFVLLVAGAGPLEPILRTEAEDPHVRLLGFRDDVARLLAAADLAVMPSRREGLSFSVLEAMARGLAVVVADGAGNAEAVGDAGLVVPAGDAGALARAFATLAGDDERRTRLGRRARARVAREFGVDVLLARVADAYRMARPGGVTAPGRGAGAAPAWPEAA